MAKTWVYNVKSQRYQDKETGKFLSADKVAALTETYIAQQQEKLVTLGDRFIAGKIDARQWEDQFAKTLKEVLVNSYALGRGGMKQMNSRDLGITSAMMREQYLYLRNFTNETMRGRLTEAQFRARQNLYIEKVHSAYWMGRVEAHRAAGYLYERDIITAGENCSSCLRIAARGWVRLGTNPPIGVDRICKNNCRCRKEFSKEAMQNYLLNSTAGWIGGSLVTERVNVVTQEVDNPYVMRSPSSDQLAKINKYRREGLPPFTASDVITIPMRASHNLVSHGRDAWMPASLANMALTMPGRPFLKDHEWESLDASLGFIYEAELLHSMIAPAEYLSGEYGEANRQIIAKDGFYQLILHVAVEATHPIVEDIEMRRADGVSTGTLTKGIYICPTCEVEFPCGQHLPPTGWIMFLKRIGELSEEEIASIVPFMYRDGNYWSCEVSQVNVPNLQGTKILG